MKNRLNWNFNDYISEIKYWNSFLKLATRNNKFIKDKIAALNEEVREFFPQECVELTGAYDSNNYLD